jgi:hypothetical protein
MKYFQNFGSFQEFPSSYEFSEVFRIIQEYQEVWKNFRSLEISRNSGIFMNFQEFLKICFWNF